MTTPHRFRLWHGRWQRRVDGEGWKWLHIHTVTEEFTRRAARTATQNDVTGERIRRYWTWEDHP